MIDRMISAMQASFGDRAVTVAQQQCDLAGPEVSATWAAIADGLRQRQPIRQDR